MLSDNARGLGFKWETLDNRTGYRIPDGVVSAASGSQADASAPIFICRARNDTFGPYSVGMASEIVATAVPMTLLMLLRNVFRSIRRNRTIGMRLKWSATV